MWSLKPIWVFGGCRYARLQLGRVGQGLWMAICYYQGERVRSWHQNQMMIGSSAGKRRDVDHGYARSEALT